jgi:hypothetical protein
MRGRLVVVGAVVSVAAPAVAAADQAVVHSQVSGLAEMSGVGCGVAASTTVPLPATATAITLRRPRVSDTTSDSRLTEATVIGTSVRLTAVGDGTTVCDPEEQPDLPPAQRPWQAGYAYAIAFHERVHVAYWPGAQLPTAKPAARPRTVRVPDIARMVRLHWRSFGGRTAVGSGRLRCEIPGCVGRGDTFKVVLDRPSRCGDVGARVFYGRIRFYTTRTYSSLTYPIRRGALYSGGRPQCRSTPITAV